MKKAIIYSLVFALVVSSLFVISSADERVYSPSGNWKYFYAGGNKELPVIQETSPTVSVLNSIALGSHWFELPDFYFPSTATCTVYGRISVSCANNYTSGLPRSMGQFQVNNIAADYVYKDGSFYFSATGQFDNYPLAIYWICNQSIGNRVVTLDYVYVEENSFVSIDATSNGESVDLLSPAEAQVVNTGASVDFSGNSFSGQIDKGNVFSVDINVPINQSMLVLSNSSLYMDFDITSGVVVDSVVQTAYGNLNHSLQTSCDFTDFSTNVYSEYSFYTAGTHSNIDDWSLTYNGPYQNGDYVQYRGHMYPDTWTEEEFYGKIVESYSYDTQHSIASSSGAYLHCDLSSLDENVDSIVITLYILGNGNYYNPLVYVSRCGVYLNVADSNLVKNESWFAPVRAFFENGISALISSFNNGWNKLVAVLSPDTDSADDFNDDMATKATELEQISDAMQSVTTPDIDSIDVDVSGIVSPDDISSGSVLLSSSFDNDLVSSMLSLSFIFALVGFVLFGKGG